MSRDLKTCKLLSNRRNEALAGAHRSGGRVPRGVIGNMGLIAQPSGCFSNRHALLRAGQATGELSVRWFGAGVDVALLGGTRWHFQREGFLRSRYVLEPIRSREVTRIGWPVGWFGARWELRLSDGPARLERLGFMRRGYRLVRGREELAKVTPVGLCSRGWCVTGDLASVVDEIFIGLIFYAIQRRRRRRAG